jgi:hypothetical protein
MHKEEKIKSQNDESEKSGTESLSADEPRNEEVNENISQEQTIETTQSETQNAQLQTENMEVHHHPHVEKKNFKEYLLEGLMIFIAVTLGFFAESYRESLNDRTKENEFMTSIVKDLESDTATYASYAKNNAEIYATIDTLTTLMNSSERNTQLSKIYFLARILTLKLLLHFPTTRTYDQMKSSGQLRIIGKPDVADSTSSYYNSLEIMNSFNEVLLAHDYDYMRMMGKVFDAGILLNILKERKEPPQKSIKLLTEDPVIINELLTAAQYIYGSLRLAQNITLQRQLSAENLIALIKKEYHAE